jgi:hypothetical protein
MDKFYVIKVINNRTGERGYVIDSKEGIMIADGFHINTTQFETEKEARQFIKDRKLERGGFTAHIRSNQDVMKEEKGGNLKPAEKDVFYIENELGEKLFYDSKEEGYFYKMGDAGYPCWFSEVDIKRFIEAYKLDDAIIKKMEKNKHTPEPEPEYFLISNSKNPKEYLHPYPFQDSKEYIWKEGLVGAGGFYEKEANEVAKNCTPIGNVVPMNSLTKNIIKE